MFNFSNKCNKPMSFFHGSYILVEISLILYIGGCMLDPILTFYISK